MYFDKRKLIIIFFFIAFICSFAFLHRNYISFHHLNFAELLLNYQGSFVRRGIVGEINYNLSEYFSLDLYKLTFIVHVVFFFIFYFFSTMFFINYKNLPFLLILAIFSPVGFLFPLAELEALGRQEIIYLAFLSFYIFFISFNKNVFLSQLLLIIFIPFILLSHEGMIFYYSYLLAANFFFLKDAKIKNYFLINFFLMIYIIGVFLLINFNITVNNDAVHNICNSLNKYLEYSKCLEINGIYKISETTSVAVNQFFEFIKIHGLFPILKFSLFAVFGFIPLFLLIDNNKKVNILYFKLKPYYLIFICLLCSGPIYLTIDWGRWTYINYISSLFLVLYLIKINIFYIKKEKIFNFLENLKFYFKFLIFILFCLWWNLKILMTDDIGAHSSYHLIRKTIIYLISFF